MTSKTIIVEAPSGLHARPTGELVNLAKGLAPTKITLTTAVKAANATSMISVIALGLKKGTQVSVSAEGADKESEQKAVDTIADFILSIQD